MKNIKLFIWDFDGTLLDTYPKITGYLRRALLDCGHDVSQTEILEKMMVTIPHAINYYSELYQLPDLRERYKAYNVEEADAPVAIFPQVKEVLQRKQRRFHLQPAGAGGDSGGIPGDCDVSQPPFCGKAGAGYHILSYGKIWRNAGKYSDDRRSCL